MASPLQRVLDTLPDHKRVGHRYCAKCPVHQGSHKDSLSVCEVEDGKVLLKCFGGCETADVLRALGLEWKELFPDHAGNGNGNGHYPAKRRRDKKAEEAAEADRISLALAAEYINVLMKPPGPTGAPNEAMGPYIGVAEELWVLFMQNESHEAVQAYWEAMRDDLAQLAPTLLKAVERRRQGQPPAPYLKDGELTEWMGELSATKDGIPRETLRNVTIALQHLEPWASSCWYDEVRDIRMVGDRELNDIMVTEASLAIEAQVKIPVRSKHLTPQALTYLCHQRPRDLLREWIENLPPWDGTLRLNTWLITHAHAPNDAYSQDVGRLLIEGLVVRALKPGVQYRYVVILEGLEDAGKTKLVRSIATPDWYRELSHGLDGKEAHMRIKRAWVAELAELASFSKTEESRLKSFFTLNEDAYIPKFSNFEVVHKRRTVFIATCNPEGDNTYLRGQTGNTRYLPIPVRNINLEGFEAVRTQLFAEALQHYRDHPDDWWMLSSDGAAVAVEVREERRQRSVYEDDLGSWLERTGRTVTWWEEIATEHLSLSRDRWNRNIQMSVTQALKALGWVKEKRERVYVGGESKLVVPWRPSSDWRTQP
jgi:predicted P-loop ATPase